MVNLMSISRDEFDALAIAVDWLDACRTEIQNVATRPPISSGIYLWPVANASSRPMAKMD
jgi:hypothetical protein